jgi:hypothetical protein
MSFPFIYFVLLYPCFPVSLFSYSPIPSFRGNIFILEGGEVALLDCGQVKQISTAQRTSLASLIILVNEWEVLDRSIRKAKEASSSAGTGGAVGVGVGERVGAAWAKEAELGLLTTALANSGMT